MAKFKREARYVVLKTKDVLNANCTPEEIETLNRICKKVTAHRISRGASPLAAVVVESDWPEYEPTWQAIERRCDGAAQTAACE